MAPRRSPHSFMVKSRTIEAATKNPYKPKGQIRYGKWCTVRRFPVIGGDILEAFREAVKYQKERVAAAGLTDWGVFWKDARITSRECKLIGPNEVTGCLAGDRSRNVRKEVLDLVARARPTRT